MIISEIFDMKFDKKIEKHEILSCFEKKGINPIKWYISSFSKNIIKIFVSYKKKPL